MTIHRTNGRYGGGNGQHHQSPAETNDDPTPEEIISQIQACVARAQEPSVYEIAADAELARELNRLVGQLSRRGPRHALILALSSASEMLTIAILRTQCQFNRDLAVFDRAKIGVSDSERLGLPEVVKEALPLISTLTDQVCDLASALGKFVHLTSLGKKRDEKDQQKRGRPTKTVGRDRNGHGGGTYGTKTPGSDRF